jgi:hypothetical protein
MLMHRRDGHAEHARQRPRVDETDGRRLALIEKSDDASRNRVDECLLVRRQQRHAHGLAPVAPAVLLAFLQ